MNVHFINLTHTSALPLLWWWYKDDNACFMFGFLQSSLNFFENKLLHVADIFLGNLYSPIIKLSGDELSVVLTIRNLL